MNFHILAWGIFALAIVYMIKDQRTKEQPRTSYLIAHYLMALCFLPAFFMRPPHQHTFWYALSNIVAATILIWVGHHDYKWSLRNMKKTTGE